MLRANTAIAPRVAEPIEMLMPQVVPMAWSQIERERPSLVTQATVVSLPTSKLLHPHGAVSLILYRGRHRTVCRTAYRSAIGWSPAIIDPRDRWLLHPYGFTARQPDLR